jgi:cytoskeleton protein RodZ
MPRAEPAPVETEKGTPAAPAKVSTPVAMPPHVVAASVAAANQAPVPNAPAGKNSLVLKVRQDSWIEVKAGSNVILSRLVKGGTTESLEVPESVALILGNAAGVDVVFRGVPLDIKADAQNNVVRLSLK